LEGGDFFPVNKDLALLGIGMRTKMCAAKYLMDNDLLGTRYFGVVVDENDFSQDRMHLDTIFNVVTDKEVVLLDFKSIQDGDKKKRTIQLYEKKQGTYNLKETLDFEKYLKREGYKIYKIDEKDQLEYLINFVHIGNNEIISVNKKLKSLLAKSNPQIKVTYVDYEGITNMYGAAHCTTQVSRIPSNTFSANQKLDL